MEGSKFSKDFVRNKVDRKTAEEPIYKICSQILKRKNYEAVSKKAIAVCEKRSKF